MNQSLQLFISSFKTILSKFLVKTRKKYISNSVEIICIFAASNSGRGLFLDSDKWQRTYVRAFCSGELLGRLMNRQILINANTI